MTISTAGYLLNQNAERHLKSPEEMARLFARWPHAIKATREFTDSLRFSLDELRYEYPRESVPEGRTPQQYLDQLTWDGAARHWSDGIPPKVDKQLRRHMRKVKDRRADPAEMFETADDAGARRGDDGAGPDEA